MTWIKICGITNLEDALTALEADANAIGFVFYDKSPRNVHPEIVRGIVERLPRLVEKVGVFVYHDSGRAVEIARHCGLTALQVQMQLPTGRTQESQGPLVAVAAGGQTRNYPAFPASWFLPGGPVSMPASALTAL